MRYNCCWNVWELMRRMSRPWPILFTLMRQSLMWVEKWTNVTLDYWAWRILTYNRASAKSVFAAMSYGPDFAAKSTVTRDCVPGHVGKLPRCTTGRRREAPSTVPTRLHASTSASTCPQLPLQPLRSKIYRLWQPCFLATKVTGLNISWFHSRGFIKDIAYVPPIPNNVELLRIPISQAILHVDE
jgi:hypothetical protein